MRSSSTILLAIDTSSRMVGTALYDGVQVLSEASWKSIDHHTVELAPAIHNAMQKTGLSFAELGAVGVALGPGSFTGLRIGLALAKGLAMVRQIPLISIPTLDVLALAQPRHDVPMIAVLRAGRGRLAAGWYEFIDDAWQSIKKTRVLTVEELADGIQSPTIVCGELSGDDRITLTQRQTNAILVSPALSLRRPAFLAELAWKRWLSGETDDPATLAPIYLHLNEPIPG